jgi:GNAT superfamily N-acetyltransferase
MQIRHADNGDFSAIIYLYSHIHEYDEPPVDIALRRAWTDLMNDRRSFIFLLEVDSLPVSSCILSIIPNLTRGARPYGIIENVVTRKEYRNMGSAGDLLSYALSYAWEKNCYTVMVLTGRTDDAVYVLYKKTGFLRGIKEGLIAYPPCR